MLNCPASAQYYRKKNNAEPIRYRIQRNPVRYRTRMFGTKQRCRMPVPDHVVNMHRMRVYGEESAQFLNIATPYHPLPPPRPLVKYLHIYVAHTVFICLQMRWKFLAVLRDPSILYYDYGNQ